MPTYYLAPDPCQSTFFIPGSNTPGNGVQVFTYATGTTTKVSVAKDVAGVALHTNPIILDSGGNLPSASSMYIEAGVEIDVVYAPSNDTDPPASAYRTISNVLGVPPQNTSSTQWVSLSAPTFVNTNAFRVTGDQTTEVHVGRRIKTTNTGGTVYSRVTSATFGTSTTVGLINDSGSLDSGLSTAAYGLLSATNPSVPLLTDFYPTVRSSTATHTQHQNIQAYTSSHVVTWPDYSVSVSSTQPVSSYTATTWTPVISNATVASYQLQNGYAVKMNNTVDWWLTFQGNVSSQAGTFSAIEGLPWNCTTNFACGGTVSQITNLNTTVAMIMCTVEAGTDQIQFRAAHAASTSVGNFALFDNTVSTVLRCAGQYVTD